LPTEKIFTDISQNKKEAFIAFIPIMNILITGAFDFVGSNLSKAPESLRVGEAPLGFSFHKPSAGGSKSTCLPPGMYSFWG
jgi:hypothetical protein